AVFAAAEIGAVFVPVNTAFAADEVGYVLDHSEAKYLLTSAEHLPLVAHARRALSALSRSAPRRAATVSAGRNFFAAAAPRHIQMSAPATSPRSPTPPARPTARRA